MTRLAWFLSLLMVATACGADPASPGGRGTDATTTTLVHTDSTFGSDRPPDLVVVAGATELTLGAHSYCWWSGTEEKRQMVCADGIPPEPLPSMTLDDDVDLAVLFPLSWSLQASLLPGGEFCNGGLVIDVDPNGTPIEQLVPAGTYRVDLFGRGEQGDAAWAFQLITTGDRETPPPYAQAFWYPSDSDLEAEAPFSTFIGNLDAPPTNVTATASVTASNGPSQQHTLSPVETGRCWEGIVGLDAPPDFTASVLELGPPPYDVTITAVIDGSTITSDSLRWPDDFPANGNESSRVGTSSSAAAPLPNLALRCVAGGDEVTTDRTTPYESAEAAVEGAAAEHDLTALEFARESMSDTWVAGSSADPAAIIELFQPDGSSEWFIDRVTVCAPGGAAAPIEHDGPPEFAALPYRVLVEGADVGDIYLTDLAATAAEFTALWSELGLIGQLPEIDFESSVVFYFGAVESSSCPLGPLEGLTYFAGDQKIYPEIPIAIPAGTTVCTADANRHAVLVSVERVALPTGGFSLWIGVEDPPGCCIDGLTFVAEGELTASPDAAYPPLGGDGHLSVGESRIAYGVGSHCGVAWLSMWINDQSWRAIDLDKTDAVGIDLVPSAWGKANHPLDLVVTLLDDATLEVTGLGTDVTVTYTADPNPPGCD